DHERRRQPRVRPPRGALAKRARRHARVRGAQELGALAARRGQLPAGLEADVELRVLHRELRELLTDGLRQARCGSPARLPELARQPAFLGAAGVELRLVARQVDLGRLEALALSAAARRVCEHGLDAAAVLSLQPVVPIEPGLDILEAPRLRLE